MPSDALPVGHGLLVRQVRVTSVYYAIAGPAAYELCNLVCDNLAQRIERTAPQHVAFARSGRQHGAEANGQQMPGL